MVSTGDILDFCFDTLKGENKQEFISELLQDKELLDAVRYIMHLKLKFEDRSQVESYLTNQKEASYKKTMEQIHKFRDQVHI